jgi:hypothetical protein
MRDESGNPAYPELGATVAKFRRIARPTQDERLAHGEAVHRAMLAKQRAELQRELPSFKPRCASGTWHTEGGKIHAAVQQQQRARLQASVAAVRKHRTPAQWQAMYDDAMKAKRRKLAA